MSHFAPHLPAQYTPTGVFGKFRTLFAPRLLSQP
jgi:hypothetical protein